MFSDCFQWELFKASNTGYSHSRSDCAPYLFLYKLVSVSGIRICTCIQKCFCLVDNVTTTHPVSVGSSKWPLNFGKGANNKVNGTEFVVLLHLVSGQQCLNEAEIIGRSSKQFRLLVLAVIYLYWLRTVLLSTLQYILQSILYIYISQVNPKHCWNDVTLAPLNELSNQSDARCFLNDHILTKTPCPLKIQHGCDW